jgi:hypothetical protein
MRNVRRSTFRITWVFLKSQKVPSILATSDVVKETLNLAGLSTNIYTRANLRDKRASEPVVMLHRRTEPADQADPTARVAFSWQLRKGLLLREVSRDFMVVTFVRSRPY